MMHTSKIRAIIFDLGGVLLRTEDPVPREKMAKRFGITRGLLEEAVFSNPVLVQAESGQATEQEGWQAIGKHFELTEEEAQKFRQEFFSGDRVDFDLIDLLKNLRTRYTTVLLSNTYMVDLPRFLSEELQITDTFDFIISSAQIGKAKPTLESFQAALEIAGLEPYQAVFVDDNAQNIEAAAAFGIHAIHFKSAGQARSELLQIVGEPG
jgi:glucose-1-phosphatase